MSVVSREQWAAVTALVAVSLFMSVPRAQTPAGAAPPQRIKGVSELQPVSDEEKARAAYFSKERTSEMTIQELVELGGGGLRLQYIQSDPRRPFLPVVCVGSRPDAEACAVAASPEAMVRLEANLRKPVCSAEAVVAGRVTAQKALLTAGEKALFTDYSVEVQQWVRPASGAPNLVVSEWGGMVEVAGKPFALTREGLTLAAGKTYLLVLGTLPGTTGFVLRNEPMELGTAAAKSIDPIPQVTRAAATCGGPG